MFIDLLSGFIVGFFGVIIGALVCYSFAYNEGMKDCKRNKS